MGSGEERKNTLAYRPLESALLDQDGADGVGEGGGGGEGLGSEGGGNMEIVTEDVIARDKGEEREGEGVGGRDVKPPQE